MTKKTQRARAATQKKPHLGDERIRPDGSVIRYVREDDDDKKVADHFRTVDTLALMLRNRTITGAMHDAGQQFSQDFARAFASGVASPKLDGLPGGTTPGQMMVERNAGAAGAVRDALDAVGGNSSPAGSALWFVAGLGLSVRDWALRLGWSGKPISVHEAKGILVAGLGVLARYYGYGRGGEQCDKRAQHTRAVAVS